MNLACADSLKLPFVPNIYHTTKKIKNCTRYSHKLTTNFDLFIPTGMNLHYDIVDPQEIDLMFSKKDVDIDGFHLVIDCTGNTFAVKKVRCYYT